MKSEKREKRVENITNGKIPFFLRLLHFFHIIRLNKVAPMQVEVEQWAEKTRKRVKTDFNVSAFITITGIMDIMSMLALILNY